MTSPDDETRAAETTDGAEEQSLSDRGSNRSLRPTSEAFRRFVSGQWGAPADEPASRLPVADHTGARRAALAAAFPGERLVVPAGSLSVRSNDTDYRYRPHTAFAHLTGLGGDREPDAVLVVDSDADGQESSTLFFKPRAGFDTDEFYSNARYGEFWVGPRPTLADAETELGIRCRHIDELPDVLAKDLGPGHVQLRVVPGADESLSTLVETLRLENGLAETADDQDTSLDEKLAEVVSELRLIKDDYEVAQLQEAVDATIRGFADVVRALPRAVDHTRGERVVEGAFEARAREEGNGLGYETIAASGAHACTLHWIRNDGVVREDDLLLLDAGVEADSLYTADVTRTLPVSGTFSEVQRRVYEAVLEAADAAFEVAKPGTTFRDVHGAAMKVIARKLGEWGLLPNGATAEESLAEDGQYHRRWMVHGTSHHLGLDVHDCAQARAEMYLDGVIAPGMVFTIEPGLYFHPNDLSVPAEYRGIGVRIEDDVLITEDGNRNLSAALPRRADDVEEWMASLR